MPWLKESADKVSAAAKELFKDEVREWRELCAAMDLEEERRSRGEEKTPKDNRFCPKTDWPFEGLRQRPLPEGGAVGGRTACVGGCVGALFLGPLTTRRGVASFLLGTFLLLSTLFLCQFWKISQLFWKSNENFCRVH